MSVKWLNKETEMKETEHPEFKICMSGQKRRVRTLEVVPGKEQERAGRRGLLQQSRPGRINKNARMAKNQTPAGQTSEKKEHNSNNEKYCQVSLNYQKVKVIWFPLRSKVKTKQQHNNKTTNKKTEKIWLFAGEMQWDSNTESSLRCPGFMIGLLSRILRNVLIRKEKQKVLTLFIYSLFKIYLEYLPWKHYNGRAGTSF